ncbi:phospholipid scramblase 1-like [Venturia canescens]|uniref:phospholipid scramblase 1-like n=1 Tax=Venturia canescens TaxID=32260 RepID=UPI001C9D038C|nr:phospholipid scramblase 1-like [Venturia canescens]
MSRIEVSTISEEYGNLTEQRTSDTYFDTIQLPVFDQPYAITSQPRIDLNRPQRRPIPVNTTDWISTPRSLFSPACSTLFLSGVKQLEIQQTVDLVSRDEVNSDVYKYRVKVPGAETLFLATEHNGGRIIGSSRGFIVDLKDATGQTAFTFKKSRSWGCVPGFLHKLTVQGTDYVGTIEQDFTLWAPRYTVYNADHEPLCLIYSPHTFCTCNYKEERFQVSSIDGCRPLASIVLQWDLEVMDYYITLTVPLDMDVKLKSLLLGAAFLMESLYFERLRNSPSR